MSRVTKMSRTVCSALALSTILFACKPGASSGRPADVLLISLDTLRADRLSCYGGPEGSTPFLDSLAATGVRAAEAYSPSAQTAPSHMSLFTGLAPFAHGVTNVSSGADECLRVANSRMTLPELFFDAGYATAIFSDGGNVLPGMGFGRGFESQRFTLGGVRGTLEAIREWLSDVDEEDPLFLFFHTYTTHAPYLPPRKFRGRFTDPEYKGEFLRRYEQLAGKRRLDSFQASGRFLDPFEGMGQRDIEFLSNLYNETVAYVDEVTERLFGIFDEYRNLDQTLSIVLSDHGEGFFEHESLGHRRGVYRELVHVPFLVNGPGLEPYVIGEPLDLTGLFSTVAEFIGLAGPADAEPSFLGALRGEPIDRPAHQQLVLGLSAGRWRATVAEGSRLIVHQGQGEDGSKTQEETVLYALDDRLEAEPLVADPRFDRLAALSAERAAKDLGLIRRAAPIKFSLSGGLGQKALEALGYTGVGSAPDDE